MSLGIQLPPPPHLSFSCSCSLCYTFMHTDVCTHTYFQMGRSSDYAHKYTKHLLLVTHRKAAKPPPLSRNLPFDFDPATLPLTLSTLLQVHWSFISLWWGWGWGVQLHLLIKSSISNSLQQHKQDQLVLGNSLLGTVWKQAAGCTTLAMVGASVHFVDSPCPAWALQSWYHLAVTLM